MPRERSTTERSSDESADAVEQVEALLLVGRAADALAIAVAFAAVVPDSHVAHVLCGNCLLALDRGHDAAHASARATALAPDDPECAVLAVRCAWDGPEGDLWNRIQRLQHIDSVSYRARYWITIGTARSGREELALDALRRLESDFVGSLEPLYAAAEVDLIIASRHRFRRPRLAATNAAELLGRDPLDQRAHRLRQRASQSRPFGSSSRLATEQLHDVKRATAAGVVPPPGQLKRLAVEAVGPVGLGLAGFALTLGFAAAVDGGLAWYLGVLAAATGWTVIWLFVRRRVTAVSAILPDLGRARMLQPIARSLGVTAGVLATCAVAGLASMFPYDVDRATSLGFSSVGAHTVTHIEYDQVPSAGGGGSTIRVPRIETVNIAESPDPDGAIRLLRYYTGMALMALAMASLLVTRSRALRRA